MFRLHFAVAGAFVAALCLAATGAMGQQATVGTTNSTTGSGYYESIGSSWGVQGPGWFFRFGGGATSPQVGGYDPNAVATGGFGFAGGGISGGFNFWAGQGSTSSIGGTTVTGNMISGTGAVISDTSVSPFVIGFVPVVGNRSQPGFVSPNILPPAFAAGGQVNSSIAGEYLKAVQRANFEQGRAVAENFRNQAPAQPQIPAEAKVAPKDFGVDPDQVPRRMVPAEGLAAAAPSGSRPSSAGRPAMSVAEARQARAAEEAAQHNEARVWLERARGAEEAGKANVAAIYYRMAAGRATGQLRQQALDRLAELKAAGDR